MKIESVVAYETFGTIFLKDEGCKMNVALKPEQSARLVALAREIFLENQRALVEQVAAVPPSLQLEAPKAEIEDAEFHDVQF